MSTATITERRVWVGCLACYNAGNLRGEWLTPADGVDWECSNPTHEETWCFDHEGFGRVGEMSPVEALEVDARMEAAEDAGIPGVVAEQWYAAYGTDENISDAFIGCAESLREYVEQGVEEGLYGDALKLAFAEQPSYIDLAAIVRDVESELTTYEVIGADYSRMLYVFRP